MSLRRRWDSHLIHCVRKPRLHSNYSDIEEVGYRFAAHSGLKYAEDLYVDITSTLLWRFADRERMLEFDKFWEPNRGVPPDWPIMRFETHLHYTDLSDGLRGVLGPGCYIRNERDPLARWVGYNDVYFPNKQYPGQSYYHLAYDPDYPPDPDFMIHLQLIS